MTVREVLAITENRTAKVRFKFAGRSVTMNLYKTDLNDRLERDEDEQKELDRILNLPVEYIKAVEDYILILTS